MKKSYVMIHVIKHDMDPNSNINYSRKIPPKSEFLHGFVSLQTSILQLNVILHERSHMAKIQSRPRPLHPFYYGCFQAKLL